MQTEKDFVQASSESRNGKGGRPSSPQASFRRHAKFYRSLRLPPKNYPALRQAGIFERHDNISSASCQNLLLIKTIPPMRPLTESDLIFSEQAGHNFSKTLGDIKRSTLSIHNRLRSIQQDAEFAEAVADTYGRPLIANERCGSWYIDPEKKAGSAYFKSTDGHTGVWKFSSRRLNLHLLEIIGKNDGYVEYSFLLEERCWFNTCRCIVVDSTRRGKRTKPIFQSIDHANMWIGMPDALSKTIPIWCSVLNHFLYPNDTRFHDVYTPPQVVSESEHVQITSLLPSFVLALETLKIPIDNLQKHIRKPIRPIWVTPESNLSPTSSIFEEFHPIICCTVSRRVAGAEVSERGYIQGAGDDTENWAHGLSPPIFWANREILTSTSESELPDLIERLVRREASSGQVGEGLRCVKPTSNLFVTPIAALAEKHTGADTCTIVLLRKITEENMWRTSPTRIDVGLGPHKVGSRNIRTALPFMMDFIEKILFLETKDEDSDVKEKRIIIACESGKDLSIGVALAIVCLFFDDDGELLKDGRRRSDIDKNFIRSRMGWISTSMPDANPSGATLQSVNSYLMERPK
jgi:tRNA A64-2'-O-ribosylphosphate transferase